MKETNYKAIDFSYLLLDFYKEMNITEEEMAVILMINHLLEQDNDFITNEVLSLKMTMSSKMIDKCMTSLYKKKYIEFDTNDATPKTSLEPIKKILYKKFEKSLFSEDEYKSNADLVEERDYIFKTFTDAFKRELSPIELSHIDDWIKNGVDKDIIINSLKDAINSNKVSISYIDALIVKKIENEQ
ncbi:MAG: DnaD domain protein [Bacilli bacterium]|jgi:DNA replication protein